MPSESIPSNCGEAGQGGCYPNRANFVRLNINDYSGLPQLRGEICIDPCAGLAHELVHAFQDEWGLSEPGDLCMEGDRDLKEVEAVQAENLYRAHNAEECCGRETYSTSTCRFDEKGFDPLAAVRLSDAANGTNLADNLRPQSACEPPHSMVFYLSGVHWNTYEEDDSPWVDFEDFGPFYCGAGDSTCIGSGIDAAVLTKLGPGSGYGWNKSYDLAARGEGNVTSVGSATWNYGDGTNSSFHIQVTVTAECTNEVARGCSIFHRGGEIELHQKVGAPGASPVQYYQVTRTDVISLSAGPNEYHRGSTATARGAEGVEQVQEGESLTVTHQEVGCAHTGAQRHSWAKFPGEEFARLLDDQALHLGVSASMSAATENNRTASASRTTTITGVQVESCP